MSLGAKFVLIGQNISHSLSPALHNFWFKQYGIKATYDLLPCTPENLREKWEDFWTGNTITFLKGANITAPFKQLIASKVLVEDELTQKVGAINTLYQRPHSPILGYNTDLRAARDLLTKTAKSAIIIGAGGAAAAVAVALHMNGCQDIFIVYRNRPPSLSIPINSILWDDFFLSSSLNTDVLINATPIQAKMDHVNVERQVIDLLYRPCETLLIKMAQYKNLDYVTGLDFLVRQAQYSFKCWFDIFPVIEDDELKLFFQE